MKKLILMMSLVLSTGLFNACSSDEDEGIIVNFEENSPKDENNTESSPMNDIQEMITRISTFNLPRKQMNVEDMPDWLADHIAQAIERNKSVPISFWYYQFRWKESTYYLIRSSYTAWLFENVYDLNGEKIDLSQSQDEVDNLLAYSSEWFIIYEV
jgi:hypothetical protein